MLVKICGITNEADALLAVGLGADALGFVFAPSPRQVSPRAVQQIIDRLPREILTVGVFRNEAPERVVEVVNGIGLRAAQLHGNESAAQSRWVAERVNFTIRAFPVGHPDIARVDEFGVSAVMVDSPSPGSGEVFDWRLAEGVVDPARLIVSGGLGPDNVGDAVAHLRPYGVDVSSGVEAEPGRKDPQKVREFIVAARQAAERIGLDRPSGNEGAGLDTDDEDRPFDWEEEA